MEEIRLLGKSWGWLLFAGIALVVIGVVALLMPLASTLGVTIALGALFLAQGVVQLIHAVQLRHHEGNIHRFLAAALGIVLGTLMLWQPGFGMLGISLMLACYFFVSAVINWVYAQEISRENGRIWLYLGTAASFLLGFYIVFTFPLSALWLPGMLLGIEFVFNGMGLIGLAFAVKPSTPHLRTSHQPM